MFLVSWRNVQADQGHLTWDDYIEKGALTAIKTVQEICQVKQINALGFCVGGTMLSSALAVLLMLLVIVVILPIQRLSRENT